KAHLSKLDRGFARLAEAVLLDDVARLCHLARGLVDLVLLPQAERLLAMGFNSLEDAQVLEGEDPIRGPGEVAPPREVAVEASELEERVARRGVPGEALEEIVEAGDRGFPLAERLAREPAIIQARRRHVGVRGEAYQLLERLGRFLVFLAEEE